MYICKQGRAEKFQTGVALTLFARENFPYGHT